MKLAWKCWVLPRTRVRIDGMSYEDGCVFVAARLYPHHPIINSVQMLP